jgi:hypothetical protein
MGLSTDIFLGLEPAEFITTFYCLNFETPPTWRARFLSLFLPGTRKPSYIPKLKLQLKLKLIYDRRPVSQTVMVSGSHLELMTRFLYSV